MSLPLEIRQRAPARAWATPLAIALGCAALMLRSVSVLAIGPTIAVGILGLTAPTRTDRWASRLRVIAVTTLGIAAFLVVRFGAQPLTAAFTRYGVVANVVAAIAEEVFFRRYVYGRLAERGEQFAVVGAALLFALVHIPMYGIAVLPLDFAAGLLLGWQRRETGSWASPAVTHVVANLLQMR